MDVTAQVRLAKALADENRLQILLLLRGEEKCACKLLEELHISQPTLSHHMKQLCEARLVVGRKEGKWMHYRLAEEGFLPLMELQAALQEPAEVVFSCQT